jgi:hypothetical protein
VFIDSNFLLVTMAQLAISALYVIAMCWLV